MSVDDRDWYIDAQRRRLEKEYRYDPKQFRSSHGEPSLPSASGVIWRTIVYCLAIYGALTLVQHAHQYLEPTAAPNDQNPPALVRPSV